MTKENLVFGLAGTVAGIIAGFLLAVNTSTSSAVADAQLQSPPASGEAKLPEGHPPVDDFALKEIARHEQILQTDPGNQESAVALANLYFDGRKFSKAASLYEQAIKQDPTNVNLITDLGSCFLQTNEFEKAIAYYNQSLAIVPDHVQTLINLGIARASLGDKAGAAQAWQRVITTHPEHPEIAKVRQAIQEVQTNQ